MQRVLDVQLIEGPQDLGRHLGPRHFWEAAIRETKTSRRNACSLGKRGVTFVRGQLAPEGALEGLVDRISFQCAAGKRIPKAVPDVLPQALDRRGVAVGVPVGEAFATVERRALSGGFECPLHEGLELPCRRTGGLSEDVAELVDLPGLAAHPPEDLAHRLAQARVAVGDDADGWPQAAGRHAAQECQRGLRAPPGA